MEEEDIASLRIMTGDDGRRQDNDEEIDVSGAEGLSVNKSISDIPDVLILFVISGNVVCTADAESEC